MGSKGIARMLEQSPTSTIPSSVIFEKTRERLSAFSLFVFVSFWVFA